MHGAFLRTVPHMRDRIGYDLSRKVARRFHGYAPPLAGDRALLPHDDSGRHGRRLPKFRWHPCAPRILETDRTCPGTGACLVAAVMRRCRLSSAMEFRPLRPSRSAFGGGEPWRRVTGASDRIYERKIAEEAVVCRAENKIPPCGQSSPQGGIRLVLCAGPFFGADGAAVYSLYSCQLLIGMSSSPIWQNAWMNALARRAFVMSGMLWSMAPRRMR